MLWKSINNKLRPGIKIKTTIKLTPKKLFSFLLNFLNAYIQVEDDTDSLRKSFSFKRHQQ